MISERPERRHLDGTGQFGKTFEHFLRGCPVDNIRLEWRSFGGKLYPVVGSKKIRFMKCVEEHSEGGSVGAHSHDPRMGLIESGAIVDEIHAGIGVPEFYFLTVAQERPCDFAATVEVGAVGDCNRHLNAAVGGRVLRNELPSGGFLSDCGRFVRQNEHRGDCRVKTFRHEFHYAITYK